MKNEFILHPNLPNARVSAVVISSKYRCFEASLNKLHTKTIYLPENPDLIPAVAGHTDLSLLHAGGNTFFVTQSIQAFSDVLAPFGAHVEYAEKKSGPTYPDDAFLNLCILGDYVIANEKSADRHVLDWLLRKRRLISVRQGYTRCAVCILDASHIITSDPGIHAAVRPYGIESLLIQSGGVMLPGYPYGFIGGASFKINRDTIVFTGRLDLLPDQNQIRSFIAYCGLKIEYLSDESCIDIGTAIPILECGS